MGEAPQDYTVQAIVDGGKVVIEGQAVDVLPKGSPVASGQSVRGWLNLNGKHGPYFKVAEERAAKSSPSASGGNRERSIERQVALKAAVEYCAGQEVVPDRVIFVAQQFDDFLASSARTPEATPHGPAADQTGGEGAVAPGPSSLVPANDESPAF